MKYAASQAIAILDHMYVCGAIFPHQWRARADRIKVRFGVR